MWRPCWIQLWKLFLVKISANFVGVIQQLCRQNFAIFWPPPPAWTVFIPWAWTKTDIFWPPPPSSCPRSYWMPPFLFFLSIYVYVKERDWLDLLLQILMIWDPLESINSPLTLITLTIYTFPSNTMVCTSNFVPKLMSLFQNIYIDKNFSFAFQTTCIPIWWFI